MANSWSRYIDPEFPFVQWIADGGALSDACFARALAMAEPDAASGLDRAGWAAQRAWVLDALDWFGRGFRALSLRPWTFPALRQAWSSAYGREPGVFASGAGGEFARRASRAIAHMGEGNSSVASVVIRARVGMDGQVERFCTDARDAGEDRCNFSGLFTGCGADGASEPSACDPYDWRSLAWRGSFEPLAADIGLTVLPPFKWTLELVRSAAAAAVAAGWREVIRQTRLNLVLLNAREAELAGVELDAELAALALSIPRELEARRWPDPTMAALGGSIASAGAAVAALVPPNPITVTAGAIIGATGLIVGALPGARGGLGGDLWGRTRPVFEVPWIGGTGPDERPTYEVPSPPGYAGAPAGSGATTPARSALLTAAASATPGLVTTSGADRRATSAPGGGSGGESSGGSGAPGESSGGDSGIGTLVLLGIAAALAR